MADFSLAWDLLFCFFNPLISYTHISQSIPKSFFLEKLTNQNPLYISLPSHVCHMPHPFYLNSLCYRNNICGGVYVMKIPSMKFFRLLLIRLYWAQISFFIISFSNVRSIFPSLKLRGKIYTQHTYMLNCRKKYTHHGVCISWFTPTNKDRSYTNAGALLDYSSVSKPNKNSLGRTSVRIWYQSQ